MRVHRYRHLGEDRPYLHTYMSWMNTTRRLHTACVYLVTCIYIYNSCPLVVSICMHEHTLTLCAAYVHICVQS